MKTIIKTEDNCIHVNDSLIPKNGSVVALMSNGVRLSGNWGSMDILAENTEIDGVPATDGQSLFDFFKANSFSSGGTEPVANGVQSINLSTAQEQKLAIGEAGETPNWSTNAGTGVHTLNIPNASPTNAGIVTKGAQTFGGLKSFPDGVSVVEPQFPENPVNLAYFQAAHSNKADLVGGIVPASQLPAYVDNVQEYADLDSFPAVGLSNVIYLALDTSLLYRWGGSDYVEIPKSIALGETSSTAYRGDRGKIAYDHTLDINNPHNVTKSQIGLSNVDNTSDIDKPISSAVASALSLKADKGEVSKVWMPDYANMETTSRVAVGGADTWTVPAGYKGFVRLFTRTYTAGVLNLDVFYINGKVVEKIWVEAQSGSGNARSGSRMGIYPVKAGDTIKVDGNLERSCHFIPGIWV